MDCITWDMDKIIYTCSAEYIGYVFPKRKWWDFSKKPREEQFTFVETFSQEEVLVLMRILESIDTAQDSEWHAGIFSGEATESVSGMPAGNYIYIPPAYRDEIWQEFIKQSRKKKRYDTLLVVDPSGRDFPDLLMRNAEDINYLAILTERPQAYEAVLAKLEQEYGLSGMVFTQYRDFVRYQRQICEGRQVLVFMGTDWFTGAGSVRRTFFRVPKSGLVLDFDTAPTCLKMFREKRIGNDYVTLAIFLDNIVKNRYNSVVNEGLQIKKGQWSYLQQNVSRTDDKNKLGEKRKGIRKWKKRRIS